MASGIVKDIDEKFCQCSICLEQFKEPKLLPCLHRFCKNCLAELIKQNRRILPCPVCREECIVPNEGLEGFKTDFYMKNITEYIQFQNSLEDDIMQECYGCSKTLKVSAYCFKCNDFLCEACHKFHVTSKITKDHQPHTLAVEDVAAKRLTLEKLASLKEAPRCFTHSEKLSELCCKTCRNTPICIACTYGIHEGHDFREVTALANEERQKLNNELAELLPYEDKILKVPHQLEVTKDKMETLVKGKKNFLQSEYANGDRRIEQKLQSLQTKHELFKSQEESKFKEEEILLRQEMEQEIQRIREKYNKLNEEKRQKVNNLLEVTQRRHEGQVSKLEDKRKVFNAACEEATEFLLVQHEDNIKKLQEISDQFESIIKRFQNLKATTSTLLTSMNDWTIVQCVPDIITATEPLLEEVKREVPDLDTLIEIKMKPVPSISLDDRVSVTTPAESVLRIESISAMGWKVCNITTTQNSRIVISGNVAKNSSFITVIDVNGKILSQQLFSLSKSAYRVNPDRMCDFMSESTIVTACDPRELGIYDIESKNYIQRNVADVTQGWPPERGVTCVASDIANDQIILGNYKCGHLYVFDRKLEFRRKLHLPKPVKGCHSIAVCRSNLIICDSEGKIAIAMNTNGDKVYELRKPIDDRGRDWTPISVCKDGRDFIYILSVGLDGGSISGVVTQHCEGEEQALTEINIPSTSYAWCLTTMRINEEEKLLVGSYHGNIYMYGLVLQD